MKWLVPILIAFLYTVPALAIDISHNTSFVSKDQKYWEKRRKAVQVIAKDIADKCQEYTQLHSIMAERANGCLYRFAVPYGGSNGFIDRPTHAKLEKRIIAIHGQLQEDNRWERHGVMLSGTAQRCKENSVKAGQEVIELMKPLGAIYVPHANTWTENW